MAKTKIRVYKEMVFVFEEASVSVRGINYDDDYGDSATPEKSDYVSLALGHQHWLNKDEVIYLAEYLLAFANRMKDPIAK